MYYVVTANADPKLAYTDAHGWEHDERIKLSGPWGTFEAAENMVRALYKAQGYRRFAALIVFPEANIAEQAAIAIRLARG